jgi:hypothetical protein
MDRKTLLHHLPSCRIGRYSFGENVMRKFCNGELIIIGTVLFLGWVLAYNIVPAKTSQEEIAFLIEPVLQGQMK